VVEELHGRLVGERPMRDASLIFPETTEGNELRRRYYLVARLLAWPVVATSTATTPSDCASEGTKQPSPWA
jgi:hypothetical protein